MSPASHSDHTTNQMAEPPRAGPSTSREPLESGPSSTNKPNKRHSKVHETLKVIQRLAKRLTKEDEKNPESVANSRKDRNLPVKLDDLVEELYYNHDEEDRKVTLTTNIPESLQDSYSPEEWKNLSFEEKWHLHRNVKSAGNVSATEAFELLVKEDDKRSKTKKRSKLDEARLKLLEAPSKLIPELLVEDKDSGELKTVDVFEDEDLADDSDDAEGPTRGLPDWVIPKNRLYRSFLQFRNELDDRTEERMLRDSYMIFDDDPLMASDPEEDTPDKPETFHLRPLKMTEVEWDDWKKKKQIPIVRHVNPAHPMVKGRKKMTGRYGMYWEHKLKPSDIAKLRDGGIGDGDPLFLEKWSGRSLSGRRYFMADDPKHESMMAELSIATLKKEGAPLTDESINKRIEELVQKLRSECGVEETDEEADESDEEADTPSTSREVQSAMSGNIRADTTETQPERSQSAMAGVVTSPDSPSKRVLPARVRKPTVKEAERREAECEEKRERRASRRSSDKGSRESLTTPTPSEVATTEKESLSSSTAASQREGSVIVVDESEKPSRAKNPPIADDYESTDDEDAPTTSELMKYHKSELIVYRDRWGMPKLAPRCCLADVVEGKWRPCPRPGRNDFMSATLAKRAYEMDLNIAWRYKAANQRICQLHSRVLRNAGYGGNVLEEMMGWMGRRDCTDLEKKLVGKELTTPFDELEREETKWLNFAKPVSAQIFMQQMRDVNKEARRFAYALRDRFRGRRARRVRRVPKGEKKETRMFEWAKHCLDQIDVKALTEEEIAALSGKERRSLAELIRINKKRLDKQELQLEKMRKKQQKKEGSQYRPMTPISCESVKGTEADFEKTIGPLIECMVRPPPPESFAHAPPIRRLSERGGKKTTTTKSNDDDEIQVVGEVTASGVPKERPPAMKNVEKKKNQIAVLPSGELIDATKYNEMWARVKKHLRKMKKTPESKMQAIEFLMRKKCMPELLKAHAKEERMRDLHVDLPSDEYIPITLTTAKNKKKVEREYLITGMRKDPLTEAATRLRNPLIFHAVRKNDPDMKLVRLMPALKSEMLRKRNPAWKKKKADDVTSKKQSVIKFIDVNGGERTVTILTGDEDEASGAPDDDDVMEVDATSRDSEAKSVEPDIVIIRNSAGIHVQENLRPATESKPTIKPTLIRRVKRTKKEMKEEAARRAARREERKEWRERRERINQEREAQGLEPIEWTKKEWVDPRIALYTRPGVIVVKRMESLKKLVEARKACLEKIQNMPTLSRLLESLVREGVMALCTVPSEKEITDEDIEAAKQNTGEQRRREIWMKEIDRFLHVHGCLPPGVPQQYIEEREEELAERMRVNVEVEKELLYEEQRQAMWDEAGAAAAAIDKDSTSDSDAGSDDDDKMKDARLVGVPSSTAPVAVRTSNPRLLKLQSVYDKLKDERRYWTREEDEQWRMKRRFQPPPKPLRPLDEYEEVTPENGPTIPAKSKLTTVPRGAILMQTAETKAIGLRRRTGKKISLKQALRRIDTSRMTLPQMKKMIAGLKKWKATRSTRQRRSKSRQQGSSKKKLQRLRGKQFVEKIGAAEESRASSTLTPAQLRSLFEWSMAPSTIEEVAKDLREHGLDVMTASRDEASESIIRLRKLKMTIYDQLKPHGMDETKPTTVKIRTVKPSTAPRLLLSKMASKPAKVQQKAKVQEVKRVETKKKEERTGKKVFKRSEMEQRRQQRMEESARRLKSGLESTEKPEREEFRRKEEKKERRVTIVEPPKKKKKIVTEGGAKRKLYVVRLKRKDKPQPTEEETRTARAVKRSSYSWAKEDPQADKEDERRYRRQKMAAREGREELAMDSDEEREERRKRMPERKRKHKKRKRRREEEREKEEEEKEEDDDEIEELDEDGNPIPKKKWRPSDPAGFSLYPMEWILRYRDHFGLPTEAGDSKRQLVFGAAYHFHHVLQASSAAIPYFAHTVKTGGNPLDHIDDQALRDSIEAKRQEEIRKREELEAAGLQAPTPPPAKGTRYRVAANQRKQLIKEKEAAKKKAVEEEENSQDDSQ